MSSPLIKWLRHIDRTSRQRDITALPFRAIARSNHKSWSHEKCFGPMSKGGRNMVSLIAPVKCDLSAYPFEGIQNMQPEVCFIMSFNL